MGIVVRISEKTYSRLKSIAEPFTDTPATVIERLLDFYDGHVTSGDGPEKTADPGVSAGISPPKVPDEPVTEQQGGKDEVITFARNLNALDLKANWPQDRRIIIIRRRNYFLLGKDTYLIIKISRSDEPFFGLGKKYIELFNELTRKSGNYYFIGLDSQSTGWLIPKNSLLNNISNGSISSSEKSGNIEYKVND